MQVISSTFDLSADGQIPLDLSVPEAPSLMLAYQLPYGVFNLRFFEQLAKPFCLSDRFNVLDVLVLDYVVGFFPLVMILNCRRVRQDQRLLWQPVQHAAPLVVREDSSNLPANRISIIPTFASFLLLSYSKFTLTSSYLISQHSLMDTDGDFSLTRAYYAGQYSVHDSEYVLRYLIPATVLLVVLGLLPPLLLLHYPLLWFERCLGKIRHYPSTEVHIFLDAFQGCFRPRMRFFAGLYFVFRFIIDLSYTLSSTWVEHFVIQATVCASYLFFSSHSADLTPKNTTSSTLSILQCFRTSPSSHFSGSTVTPWFTSTLIGDRLPWPSGCSTSWCFYH